MKCKSKKSGILVNVDGFCKDIESELIGFLFFNECVVWFLNLVKGCMNNFWFVNGCICVLIVLFRIVVLVSIC